MDQLRQFVRLDLSRLWLQLDQLLRLHRRDLLDQSIQLDQFVRLDQLLRLRQRHQLHLCHLSRLCRQFHLCHLWLQRVQLDLWRP